MVRSTLAATSLRRSKKILPTTIQSLLEKIRSVLAGQPVYLVGGAVRDLLLGRTTNDLDFIVPANGTRAARRVADALGAAYYPLDQERDIGRVISISADGSRQILDFGVQHGPDLESDLRARDFPINAIALSLEAPQALIDPLRGAADLLEKRLRACSPTAFLDDPVRILRAVRMAAAFDLTIEKETRQHLRRALPGLAGVSPERMRDELFKILDTPSPHASLRVLDRIGALPYTLPELVQLKGVTQSPPHISDVWEHTLDALRQMEMILAVLAPVPDPDKSASLYHGLVAVQLGRFREPLADHLNNSLSTGRSLRALLYLAVLYHDVAKPQTRQVEASGRVRFFEHEEIGAEIAYERGRALRLSNPECERLQAIVRFHLRPLLLSQGDRAPTPRAIYRFFRAAGAAGVDAALFSLADVLATYGPTLPSDIWSRHLAVVRLLLEAWWERQEQRVSPPPLVSGDDLISILGIKQGPVIGELLEAIREAQASGGINSREGALELAKSLLRPDGKPAP